MAAARPAVCVGRILPHKGIDRIIRALPPGLKLRVVGRVYNEKPHAAGRLPKGRTSSSFSMRRTVLSWMYQKSSLFVQASCAQDVYGNVARKTELMGLTTIEAMACGLPVIVSADGGSTAGTGDRSPFRSGIQRRSGIRASCAAPSGAWPSPGASAAARDHVVGTYGLAATAAVWAISRSRCKRVDKKGGMRILIITNLYPPHVLGG